MDPKRMKVAELRKELKKRQIISTGTKADLVARLKACLLLDEVRAPDDVSKKQNEDDDYDENDDENEDENDDEDDDDNDDENEDNTDYTSDHTMRSSLIIGDHLLRHAILTVTPEYLKIEKVEPVGMPYVLDLELETPTQMPLDTGSDATTDGQEKVQELVQPYVLVETKLPDLEMIVAPHYQLKIDHTPCRLSQKEIDVVDLQVEEQFKNGIIEQCLSTCSSKVIPFVLSNPPRVFEGAIKRIQPTSKLRQKFQGPYHVTAVKSKDSCDVQLDARIGGPATATAYAEFVKPWHKHSGRKLIQGGRM
ncbi:hypothetical protein GE061_013126 [Apolygus lucorum]|uniref:SAP domain-containing protein n=1 Tax=Apolygus lucorum TaxID=248454 RepID=A0A8S9XU92_APOLU|nr:hypothetical protein GE061_013126 [Apolygus lucorum]